MARSKKTQHDETPSTPRVRRAKKALDNVEQDAVQLQEVQQDAPESPAPAAVPGSSRFYLSLEEIVNSNSSIDNNSSTKETKNMATFTYRKTNTIGQAIYGIDGRPGVILIGKQLFAGEPPAELEIAIDVPEPVVKEKKASAPKLTAEERKALREAMTPEQKLAEQEERLRKQAENLAARKAKLQAASQSAAM